MKVFVLLDTKEDILKNLGNRAVLGHHWLPWYFFPTMEIVIVSPLVALVDDQVKEVAKLGLCAAQLGMHNDRKSWRGKQRKCVYCSELAWFAWAYCTMQQFPNTCHKTKILTKMKGPTSERERKSSPNSGSENDSMPDRNSKGKRNDDNTSVAGCITHASVLAPDFTETEPPAGDWNREDTSFIQYRLFCCCCCSFVKNMTWLWLEH